MIVISMKGEPGSITPLLMTKPNRLVVNFASTDVEKIRGKIKSSESGLNEIRIGGENSTAKVVMDFGDNPIPAYTIKREKAQALVVFDNFQAVKIEDKSSLGQWIGADLQPVDTQVHSKTNADGSPWAEPAQAKGTPEEAPGSQEGATPKSEQVLAQAGVSSQNAERYRPPVSVPMRQVQPADRPQTNQRSRQQGIPSAPGPGMRGGVRENIPPITPPEPDPRLLVQEVTELKFIQVGHNSRLMIRGGDHLDYRLDRISQTKLKLDLINAEIPKVYQKPVKTDVFSTSVEMIIPGSQTIFIQLKEPAHYKVEKKKGVLMVDFSPPRFELTPEMKAAGKAGPVTSSDIKPQAGTGISNSSSQAAPGQVQENPEDCETSITCLKNRVDEHAAARSKKKKFGEPPSAELLNKTVTMDFQDIKLKNAFRLLSEQAAVNISLDPEVDGKDGKEGKEAKTTLRLQNVPLKDVIETILVTNDLASIMVGDVMRIGKTKKIGEFRAEIRAEIEILDQKITADKNKIKMLEERKRKEENPGLTGGLAGVQEVGEAGCFKVNEEEICLYREVVRLTYQKPEPVVIVLKCMFNRDCKDAPGGQTVQGQKDERQKTLEQVKSTMADQGFTPDSPMGQSRLQAATTQILDTQRTDLQASAAESQKTGPSTSAVVPTAAKDPRTEAIIQNSTLTANTEFRRIFITDTLERIHQMKKVIRSLDVPDPQVMIESRIVQTTKSWGRTLGIKWGGRNNQYGTIENNKKAYWGLTGHQNSILYPPGSTGPANTATGSGIINTTQPGGTTPFPSGQPSPPLNIPSTYVVNLPAMPFGNSALLREVMGLGMQFGLLGSQYITELDMRIQLGEGSGDLKTIARPKIQILDRQKASILRGTQIPYETTGGMLGPTTQFVDAVLLLEVTPTIYSVGRIGMDLLIKDNYPEWARARTTDGSQPPIGKREAKTNLTVKDGETVVIGGIIRDENRQAREGWPGLMNIPLVGYLFSNKLKEKYLEELIIFITPTIVKRPPEAS
jgi:type IV pilus assembly protein PilQ